MKKLVVFVCNGNIHRSAVAEAYLKQVIKERELDNQLEVISRGLQGSAGTSPPRHSGPTEYPLEWSIQKPILKELGIDISEHVSRPIDHKIIEEASLIFAMDSKVLSGLPNSLLKQFPDHDRKIMLFGGLGGKGVDVPDCGGSDDSKLHRRVDEVIIQVINEEIEALMRE